MKPWAWYQVTPTSKYHMAYEFRDGGIVIGLCHPSSAPTKLMEGQPVNPSQIPKGAVCRTCTNRLKNRIEFYLGLLEELAANGR